MFPPRRFHPNPILFGPGLGFDPFLFGFGFGPYCDPFWNNFGCDGFGRTAVRRLAEYPHDCRSDLRDRRKRAPGVGRAAAR